MSSTTAQRKAWNEAMRTASGTAALPPALQPRTHKRRSDRRKTTDRQNKARKVSSVLDGSHDGQEFLAAAWMDALEDVVNTGSGSGGGEGVDDDGDDSYDELEELEGKNSKTKRGTRRGGGPTKKKRKKQQQDTGNLPKRFKPRSMANILLEEVNREDGIALDWLEEEARYCHRHGPSSTSQLLRLPPKRKVCSVTGMDGIYTEPKSGLPYANLKALEQVRERPPPWMVLNGSITYTETVKSIRDNNDTWTQAHKTRMSPSLKWPITATNTIKIS